MHVGVRGRSVMFFTFCVNNARPHNGRKWRSCVIQEEIASVFVADLDAVCSVFFSGKKSSFQTKKRLWKLSLSGATIGAPMREKIFKIGENGCKICAQHFDHLEARWKKNSTIPFYHVGYWACLKTRLLITEGHRRKVSGKENPRKTKNNQQCYWMHWCKKMKRVWLITQSWKKKHMTEKLGVNEKEPAFCPENTNNHFTL